MFTITYLPLLLITQSVNSSHYGAADLSRSFIIEIDETNPKESFFGRIPHDVLGLISEYAPCSALFSVSKAGKIASEASIHSRGDVINQVFEALFNDTFFDIQLLQSHRHVVVNVLNSIKMSLLQLLQE